MGEVIQLCKCATIQNEELTRARKRLHEQALEIEKLTKKLNGMLGHRR